MSTAAEVVIGFLLMAAFYGIGLLILVALTGEVR